VCPNGHELLAIPAMAKLHRALALVIISSGERLTPPEVTFLRKYLGLSNQEFAKVMNVSESQASRRANGDEMGGPAERVAYLKGLADTPARGRIALKKRSDDWKPIAA
jgi:hypothetical protein